jgi:HTH-type transcriptional regulator / antitoxin HigA
MAAITKKRATKTKTERDLYSDLISAFPLRPIRSDAELDRAIAVINSLIDRDDRTREEDDYLEVLGDLVQKCEAEHHPLAPVSDGDMLRHLMEAKGVKQAEVVASTKIAKSTLSAVLRGRRRLTRDQIGSLSQYFRVVPSVFAFEPLRPEHDDEPQSA